MTRTLIVRGETFEDSGITLMRRILAPDDGAAAQQSDISSIALTVTDEETQTKTVDGLALTVSDVIFNSLQTSDARWNNNGGDSDGYNFLHEVPGSAFPNGNRTYRVEYWCTPATGQAFPVVFAVPVKELRVS